MGTSEIIKLIGYAVPLVIIFSLIGMLIFADKDKSNRVPKPKSKKGMKKRIAELENDVAILDRENTACFRRNQVLADKILSLELEITALKKEKDVLIIEKHKILNENGELLQENVELLEKLKEKRKTRKK